MGGGRKGANCFFHNYKQENKTLGDEHGSIALSTSPKSYLPWDRGQWKSHFRKLEFTHTLSVRVGICNVSYSPECLNTQAAASGTVLRGSETFGTGGLTGRWTWATDVRSHELHSPFTSSLSCLLVAGMRPCVLSSPPQAFPTMMDYILWTMDQNKPVLSRFCHRLLTMMQ